MRIVGVDPGETTGLSAWQDGSLLHGQEARSPEEIVEFIWRYKPDQVVMEDFIVRPRPSNVKPPVKIMGIVEYVCGILGIPVRLQSPSILRHMMPRADGLHRSDHVRSSCAHVIYFIKTTGGTQ